MYCDKCGKEVTGNVKFCTNCGAKLEEMPTKHPTNGYRGDMSKTSTSKIIGFIPIILMAILGIMFMSTGISHFQGNVDAFDWTSNSAKAVGIILHWGIMCVFLGTCVECIFNFLGRGMKGEILITNGITIFVFALLLQIGHWIFNDWNSEDMSIIMYRVLGTYTNLIGVSIFFAIILFVIGILLMKISDTQLKS